MAQGETDVVHGILKSTSKLGYLFMKNVRGKFKTLDGSRVVSAGLSLDGSGDLIGIRQVLITPDMVGKTIGQFASIEVKKDGGRVRPEQENFAAIVKRHGGFAAICYSVEEAMELVKRPFV